jgi:hypothetical protein
LECILLHNTFPSATVFSLYIFTLLMFRKLNKLQLTKIKQQNFISIRAFDSRLYLDISRFFKWKESFIFRHFKVFLVSQIFTCALSDLLLLSCFCIARIHFKSSHTRQFWTQIMPNLKYLYCVLYILINYFFKQIVDIFFSKAYYQESYILIIEYSSVVIVAEWLDGS